MPGTPSPTQAITVPADKAVQFLQGRVASLRGRVDSDERIVIALAGVPGSGKSTIAAEVLNGLTCCGVHDVAVVPMDGFHHSKTVLATFPDPIEAFRRRGAPFTFDAAAFVEAVRSMRALRVTRYNDPTLAIWLPSFDHAVQDPVTEDVCIPSTVRVVIVEGNYTLFNQSPWNEIAELANDKWFIHVPRAVAKQRLAKRHLFAGIETTHETGAMRAEENDLPNGDAITANLINPNVIIES